MYIRTHHFPIMFSLCRSCFVSTSPRKPSMFLLTKILINNTFYSLPIPRTFQHPNTLINKLHDSQKFHNSNKIILLDLLISSKTPVIFVVVTPKEFTRFHVASASKYWLFSSPWCWLILLLSTWAVFLGVSLFCCVHFGLAWGMK